MNESAKNQVLAAISTVDNLYHRLVLLAGESGSGKTTVLQALAQELPAELVNVNLDVSAHLLELTARQRVLRLPEVLDQIVGEASSPVLLDNLEILFDRNLQQDPLRLLQALSRNRTIVATWGGSVVGGKLLYAQLGHDEYRSYDDPGAVIVSLGTASQAEQTE